MRNVVFKNLTSAYLQRSLLENGLFTDRIIPIFDCGEYADYVINSSQFIQVNKNQHYGLISHRIVSHKNSVRTYQVPHPHAYAILCNELKESWPRLSKKIKQNWNQEQINLLHVRKMQNYKNCIFKMDYSKKKGEVSDILLNNAIGMRYMVRADISNFFPSLYSHSITWVAAGRKNAFNNRSKDQYWYNKLDKAIRNCHEKESVGLPIGPHTSNVISDYVLSHVDKVLLDNGFLFIRYIDDYQCFAESKERADEFLILLSDELAKIRLTINRSKTGINELPHVFDHTWPNIIKNYPFSNREESKLIFGDKNYREIISFLDFVLELSKKNKDDASLRYALKMLSKAELSDKAFYVLERYTKYLILLYPYLSDFAFIIYENAGYIPGSTDFVEELIEVALNKKLYASVSRAIYCCLLFDMQSNKVEGLIDQIIKTEDCVAITALLIYCYKNGIDLLPIIDFSKIVIASGRTDEYWVLVYQLFLGGHLKRNDINGKYDGFQSFKLLKDAKVSFLKSF